MLVSRLPAWRSRLVVAVLSLGFLALALKALWVQGIGNNFYRHQGELRQTRELLLAASRGRILDRNDHLLAISLPVRSIWAIPTDVPRDTPPATLHALSQLLGTSTQALRRELFQDKRFVYLKRQIPITTAEQILKLGIAGIYADKDYKRFYPEGGITAHVVGFTNDSDVGQDGIELASEPRLLAVPGRRRVLVNARGQTIQELGIMVPPRNGQDVVLSIDDRIQYAAFDALRDAVRKTQAKSGSAVVLDARNGEVLALANWPTYDPNQRAQLSGPHLRNGALADAFEPGSVIKPITIALALQAHAITPRTIVPTAPGRLRLDGATITDDGDFGTLTVGGVLQKSSNVGTTKISMLLTPKQMWTMFNAVGIGRAPRIGSPGATAGRLRPYRHWRRIEQATMSYGYGLSVSLLQLARAYTIFAHQGQVLPVTIFKGQQTWIKGKQIISPVTAREVRTMLASVVTAKGTAADVRVPGYAVGGKTGTAYKYTKHGYDRSHYRASFVGLAPIAAPRVIIAVSINDPTAGSHFGGQVAGPVFSRIAARTMSILDVPPQAPATPPAAVTPGSAPAPRTTT
jgi:cell division protein FtsI (penicillin-binding protein 3)